jgi:hypothetical protein
LFGEQQEFKRPCINGIIYCTCFAAWQSRPQRWGLPPSALLLVMPIKCCKPFSSRECGMSCAGDPKVMPPSLRTVMAACFLGVCDCSGCPHSGAARVGGGLLQQWHLWLVDPPPSVCEMVWRVVVLAAIWAMEQGRKRLWSLAHTPPRQRFCCAACRFQSFHFLLV